MSTWRLDIDEAAIYCGDKRVAALASDCSNDGWREACRVGQDIVDAMNGADRPGFEARMRAAGHSPTALSRLSDGAYLSPTVQSNWRSELDVASYRRDREIEVLHAKLAHERAKNEHAVRLLTGIHALLYPPPIIVSEGHLMVFRPKNLDPHTLMQELSDRIRALPDELAKEPA